MSKQVYKKTGKWNRRHHLRKYLRVYLFLCLLFLSKSSGNVIFCPFFFRRGKHSFSFTIFDQFPL